MTARGGIMPPASARYASRHQVAAWRSLEQPSDNGERECGDVLAELLRLVGHEAAVILLEEYGGTRMSVPLAASQSTRLTCLIGLPAASTLSASFGGRYLRIPVGRACRAAAYRDRGWTFSKIAKALCMTDSAVARMLKNERSRTSPDGKDQVARLSHPCQVP